MSHPDPILLKIYAGEQAEHVARIRTLLGVLPSGDQAVLEELFRRAHTLKGAARAVGIDETERIVHRMESLFSRFSEHDATPDAAAVDALSRALDCIEDVLASVLGERSLPDWQSAVRSLDALTGDSPSSKPAPEPSAAPAEDAPTGGFIRVNAHTLDALIRVSSQLVGSTSADPETARQTAELASEVGETARQYARLRRACAPLLRKAQGDAKFAPLAECLEFVDNRLNALAAASMRLARVRQQAEWRLRRQVEELNQYTAQARMTPAGEAFGMFGPMVRSLAEEQGKQVAFRAEGLEARADRSVLQGLKDPVMHLLRNAVSHGVEPPSVRVAAGKPETGLVALRVQSRGDRLWLTVEDDGAGLDLAALRQEALRRGMRDPRDDELTRLAFTPGFSTARSVSTASGRGMGLAAVNEAVAKLRGEASLGAREGGGSVASISVPLTIATEHVLLVAEGGETFALPASIIEAIVRRKTDEIVLVNARECAVIGGEALPLVRLSELLGIEGAAGTPEPARFIHVVAMKSGVGRAAVAVERVIDGREAIVRETGLPARFNGLAAGAIALEDGTVAPMLAGADLVERFLASGGAKRRLMPAEDRERKRRILVVDDSITTRSLERSILEAHGFEVELAVDGLEALEKVRARAADLVISDVAMPRMNGFELLEKLKSAKETANIPVILVTSLESPQEQERGLSLGADAYIVKRKFDQRELLATVRQIL